MTQVRSSEPQSETKNQFSVLLSSGNGLQVRQCTSLPDLPELIFSIKGERKGVRTGEANVAEKEIRLYLSI